MPEKVWDLFISHSSEDKQAIVRPLVEALQRGAVKVWYDEHELQVGDSLSRKIDEGLASSAYGVVVLSASFLAKHWPKKELAGLRALESEDQKVILPIWHQVDRATVAAYSPTLADVIALNTERGISEVADQLIKVVYSSRSKAPSKHSPSAARRFIELIESSPQRGQIIQFLRIHGGVFFYGSGTFDPFELLGRSFDASARHAGHHLQLSLYLFTDVCGDPFAEVSDVVAVHDSLQLTLGAAREVLARFTEDKEAAENVKTALLRSAPWGEHLRKQPVHLQIVVFAGRRKFIDRQLKTHLAWSELRKASATIIPSGAPAIQLVTYDTIVECLLGNESPPQSGMR